VKVFAFFVLVLAALVPAHADTLWDFSFSPNECFSASCPSGSGQFTTVRETGLFDLEGSVTPFIGDVLTSLTGTLDGQTVTWIPGGTNPITGWLEADVPQDIEFSVDGVTYFLQYDTGNGIFLTSSAEGETVNWSAVEVPEPAAVWLLLTALLLLASFAFRSSPKPAL
jgi:hypothetical protein